MVRLTDGDRLFITSKYSDLVIKSQDQEFQVHKVIVGGQSEYFDEMFNGPWKVS